MTVTECFEDQKTAGDIRLTGEEMVTLFMNLIAFDGDWTAHLDFLNSLDGRHATESGQISLVRDLQRKDMEFDIQAAVQDTE